jgi:peptidoglycan/LPS O-acetylase OafA/YrhL
MTATVDRETAGGGLPAAVAARFPALDAARAIGAVAVVATHVAFWTGRSADGPFAATLARLDVGVAVFFVLAGFLLARPWLIAHRLGRPAPRVRGYLWRRALRILPAYWVVVAVALVAVPDNRGQSGPLTWLRHATLTQVYGLGWQRHALTQTWSLAVEAAFYLVLPVLLVLVLGRTRRWDVRPAVAVLAGLAVLAPLWHVSLPWLGLDSRVAGQWLPGYLGWFAGGMALSLVEVDGVHARTPRAFAVVREIARSTWLCWTVALAALLVATTPLAGPRDLSTPTEAAAATKNVLYLVVAVAFLLPLTVGHADGGRTRAVLASPPLAWLGRVSYGVFLWHLLVLEVVVRVLDQQLFTGSWVVTFAATLAGAVAVAAVSYLVLERPVSRLRSRVPMYEGRSVEAQTAPRPSRQSAWDQPAPAE